LDDPAVDLPLDAVVEFDQVKADPAPEPDPEPKLTSKFPPATVQPVAGVWSSVGRLSNASKAVASAKSGLEDAKAMLARRELADIECIAAGMTREPLEDFRLIVERAEFELGQCKRGRDLATKHDADRRGKALTDTQLQDLDDRISEAVDATLASLDSIAPALGRLIAVKPDIERMLGRAHVANWIQTQMQAIESFIHLVPLIRQAKVWSNWRQ
jgi:hypothetical protein